MPYFLNHENYKAFQKANVTI